MSVNKSSVRRLFFLLLIFVLIFSYIIFRLFDIQVLKHKFYKNKTANQRTRTVALAADRGDIYDRNGNLFATSIDSFSVYIAPQQIKDKKKTANKLAKIFKKKIPWALKQVNSKRSFLWIERKVSEQMKKKIEKADIEGIGFLMEKKRVYPKGFLAAQLVGFTGMDNQGLSGIELYYDKYLKGKEGQIIMELDAKGREIITGSSRKLSDATNGMSITLTIDETIQYFAERELAKALKKYRGISGTVVVMDPNNGDILAMATLPSFDPNKFSKYPSKNWSISAVLKMYEPGSTFKTITINAALSDRLMSPYRTFYCPDSLKVSDRIIKNSHAINGKSRNISVAEILAQSLNTGVVQIGDLMGKNRFYTHMKNFGFGSFTRVGLPGETSGIVKKVKDWYGADKAMMTFGQTIGVNALQMTNAYSAIANGGALMKPRIIKKIESFDKQKVNKYPQKKIRQAVSTASTKQTMKLLEYVVEKGSGHLCKSKSYRIGGKTGTAQKASRQGGYLTNKYMASFVAIAPLSKPRLVVYFAIDEPVGTIWGEVVAAPYVKTIIEDSFRYLGIEADKVG